MPVIESSVNPTYTIQESLFKLIFENAAVGIAQIDHKGQLLMVNSKFSDITGYTKEELLHKTFQELTHQDDLKADLALAEALFRGEINSYSMEKRYIRKDGTIVWVKLNGSAVFDDHGKFNMFVGVVEDITEKKIAEAALKENQDQLSNILNSITDCYLSLDKDWKILNVNKVAEQLIFNRPAEELAGKIFWDLYPKGKGDVFHLEYERAFRENVSVHFEAKSNVTDKWLEVHAYPRGNYLEIFFRDITKRKKLEDALVKSEKKFSGLFFNSPAFMVISDIKTGEIFEANDSFSNITGYSRDEMIGKTPIELGIALKESRQKIADEIIKEGNVQLHEAHITDRSNNIRTILFSASSININNQSFFITSGIDITRHKKTEEALHASELNYKIASSAAKIGAYYRNLETGENYWSPELLKIYGLKPEDPFLLKDGIPEAVHPDDRVIAVDLAKKHFDPAHNSDFKHDHRIILPDGTIRWIHVRGVTEFDIRAKPVRTYGIVMDITERKEVEEALKESEERFRVLANNMSQLAWIMDDKGWVFWFNQRWYEYTGTTLEEMQGWGWQKVHHPDHIYRVLESKKHSIETGEVWEELFPIRNKEGQYRWFLTLAIPLKDESGKIIQWLGTNTDITHQQNIEKRLKNDNKLFEDLLYIAAHDLKSPVANMYGALEIMDNLAIQDKLMLLSRFRELADQLNLTILGVTNILSMRNNDRSAATVINIGTLLDKVLLEFNDQSGQVSIQRNLEKPDISYIELFLYSIIKNLFSNAIKYRREDVALTVKITTQSTADFTLLTISDNGIGIDLDSYGKKLFSPFHRVNPKKNKGTGIGLYMIKDILELNGGYITVESTPGKGTTFYCYLKEY
jgi:PAS domain S-box-containing protein